MYCYLLTHHEFLYFTNFYSNSFSVRNKTSCSKSNLPEKTGPLFLPFVELLIGRVNPTFSYVCSGLWHLNYKRFLTSGDKHISVCKNMTSKLSKIRRFIHWRVRIHLSLQLKTTFWKDISDVLLFPRKKSFIYNHFSVKEKFQVACQKMALTLTVISYLFSKQEQSLVPLLFSSFPASDVINHYRLISKQRQNWVSLSISVLNDIDIISRRK